ncbi:MAG: Gfo/Idh/MocA family oxidoreductase [Eubacteriales bacterium]|jgi:predicted dehydrogenase|nr:Gfo/Idh/MocA family oxidoreductase [Clostridiales bacterium]
MKAKILLVGIGGYGGLYVNEVLNPKNSDKMELVGIVDPYPQSCPRLAELTNLCGQPYADMESFYKEKTADLAVISTPIHFHAEQIKTALKYGSNVLCEKPLCGDDADIEPLIMARRAAGKFVYIGYQWSHSEAIYALKNDIIAGVYGSPVSLRTLVLWPRGARYFRRGTGWAGKISSSDGKMIYDSVANNAAAHYLHNMLYVTGDSINKSRSVTSVTALLARAYEIENFDTSIIRCTLDGGGDTLFIASHAIHINVNPIFDYQFTGGRVTYSQDPLPSSINAEDYVPGHIIGKTKDGKTIDYGDPFVFPERKLHIAVDAVLGKPSGAELCGIEAASQHTRVINTIQKNANIRSFCPDLIRRRGDVTCVEGLAERLIAVYNGEAEDFCDMVV